MIYKRTAPVCIASTKHYHFTLHKGPHLTYLEIRWLLAYIINAGTLIYVMLLSHNLMTYYAS